MANIKQKITTALGLAVVLFFAVIFFDQWLVAKLSQPDFFQAGQTLFLYKNYNFVFSLPLPTAAGYAVSGATLIAMTAWWFLTTKRRNWQFDLGYSLILAGAAGNLAHRLWLGFVWDYIHLSLGQLSGFWNLADGVIIMGIILWVREMVFSLNSKTQIPNNK